MLKTTFNYLDVYPDDSRVIAQMALCLYELNNKEALEYARKAKLLDGKNLLAVVFNHKF